MFLRLRAAFVKVIDHDSWPKLYQIIIAQITPILLYVFIAFQGAALGFLRHNFRHRDEEHFYLIPT
jgi:UDP-N-acetylmuramyl pentapeptide phosphotransferase/UDP-N-acetylglucosamine-1-phosphate transferase